MSKIAEWTISATHKYNSQALCCFTKDCKQTYPAVKWTKAEAADGIIYKGLKVVRRDTKEALAEGGWWSWGSSLSENCDSNTTILAFAVLTVSFR